MQKHIKNYLKYYWIDNVYDLRCEVCWMWWEWMEIHHIIYRSHFWKNKKNEQDNIGNLICLDRFCHEKAHGIGNKWKLTPEELQEIHNQNL